MLIDDLVDDGMVNGLVLIKVVNSFLDFVLGGCLYMVSTYDNKVKSELVVYWFVYGMNHVWFGGDGL